MNSNTLASSITTTSVFSQIYALLLCKFPILLERSSSPVFILKSKSPPVITKGLGLFSCGWNIEGENNDRTERKQDMHKGKGMERMEGWKASLKRLGTLHFTKKRIAPAN
jgi:hypothetical protein